jgi:hypothetical protein
MLRRRLPDREKEEEMNYWDTELTTLAFMDLSMIVSSVNDAAERFSKGGWIKGKEWPSRWKELKAYLKASEDRYHDARIAGVNVLAGSVAGRILVTFSKVAHNGIAQVTVIGGEDEPDRGCGLQSIAATPNEVLSMIDSVIVGWNLESFKATFKAGIA